MRTERKRYERKEPLVGLQTTDLLAKYWWLDEKLQLRKAIRDFPGVGPYAPIVARLGSVEAAYIHLACNSHDPLAAYYRAAEVVFGELAEHGAATPLAQAALNACRAEVEMVVRQHSQDKINPKEA